jgi:hypothetical protein
MAFVELDRLGEHGVKVIIDACRGKKSCFLLARLPPKS